MANLIHLNAEFDSYKSFKLAFNKYRHQNAINGVPLRFKYKKTDKVPKNADPENVSKFKFQELEGKCLHHDLNNQHSNGNQSHCEGHITYRIYHNPEVVRITKFNGHHINHPMPDNDQMRSILMGIFEAASASNEQQIIGTIMVVDKLLEYTQSGAGCMVNFVPLPIGNKESTASQNKPLVQRATSTCNNNPSTSAFQIETEESMMINDEVIIDDLAELFECGPTSSTHDENADLQEIDQTNAESNEIEPILRDSTSTHTNSNDENGNILLTSWHSLDSTFELRVEKDTINVTKENATNEADGKSSKARTKSMESNEHLVNDGKTNETNATPKVSSGKRIGERLSTCDELFKARRKIRDQNPDDDENTSPNIMLMIPIKKETDLMVDHPNA